MEQEREVLELEPIADTPEVGRWLSAMEDARRDTLREVEGLSDEALDWRPSPGDNSIGTLLYHIALVEADWLFAEILEVEGEPSQLQGMLPFTDRDLEGRLTRTDGMTLEEHLNRLSAIRSLLLERVQPMDIEEFHRLRRRERFDVSPAWVLHHLLQHEAEHRAQIAWLREAGRSSFRAPA